MFCNTGAARRIKPWLFGTTCIAAAVWSSVANSQAYSQPYIQAPPAPSAPPPQTNILSRPFVIVPTVGLQETFTDNVDLSEHPESDFITRLTAGATAQVDHGRLTGHLNGQGFYDRYARHPSFSGWSVNADAQATYAIVRDRLSIEAAGNISDEDASLFNGSAIDRSGTPGRTRISVYYIGPKLTTDIRDFAKLTAAGRVGQVHYSADDNSQEPFQLPSNDTFLQGLARLDTGERVRPYQLLTTSVIEKDNRDYSSANLVQSVFYRVRPGVRVLGRAGYERVRQQGVANIDSPVLSVGLEFRPNEDSRVTVEGGERYNRSAWALRADVRLAPRFRLFARHTEVLAPDQIHLANDFDEFIAESESLPIPSISRSFQFGQNIYNQTSYNKVSQASLEYNGAVNFFSLSTVYSDRLFLDTDTKDRSLSADISATRHVRPDLDLTVGGSYTKTYESPLYGASHTFGADATLNYQVNTTVDLQAGYSYRKGTEVFVGGFQYRENVAFISIQKRL
jgi:uncharacterized protein (PEP-CTERM system associated)